MKTIGEIRQARLKQFVTQTAMKFADINGALGRNRRDATLNQVVQAAPNTRTGKPRRMGDAQARLLENTFKLPEGWFDSDPDIHPDVIAKSADGKWIVMETKALASAPPLSQEQMPAYRANGWPFDTVQLADVLAMSPADRSTLERVMLAFMGSATALPDWRTTALRLASKLDHDHRTDNFTLFVRAIDIELGRASAPRRAKKEARP
jgi:hypothetical protein